MKIATQCKVISMIGVVLLVAPVVNAEARPDSSPSKKKSLTILKKETGLTGKKLRRHLTLLKEAPPYANNELQAYVTRIGKKILAQSEHAHLPYQFIVRDTETVNAFVNGTPYVFVERGLLSLLNSEAELAAVMAHEIGHNVARHTAKLQSSRRRNIFLANVASILVGNSSVGSAIHTQSSVNLLEYKRDAELEADAFAARYLFGAKYEPSQLVSALAQLRNNNIFAAKTLDTPLPHHGLLTSHPRSDVRLRNAIADAGVFPPGEAFIGREAYRNAISGMTYGPNYARNAPPGLRRYTNERLGITFLHPQDWIRTIRGGKIILKDPAQSVQFKITIEKTPEASRGKTSLQDLHAKYPNLDLYEKIHLDSQRDLGTLGAAMAKRVALVKVSRNTFHFEGMAKNNDITAEQDATFVKMIRRFRRLTPKDKTAEHVTKIYYERLKPGETFASISKGVGRDDLSAEIELRVLNGYYPKGQPEPGTWVKKLRKEKIEY